MNAIVSGANGFIGSSVVKRLLLEGDNVLALDLAEKPSRLPLGDPKLIYLQSRADNFCLPPDKIGNYSVFFHFAWSGASGDERKDVNLQIANIQSFLDTMRCAKKSGCSRFVFASSIIETESRKLVYSNSASPDLHYIYGGAKGACHLLGKPFASSLGLDLVWANITSVYGVGDYSNGFINSTLKKILNKEDLDFTKGDQLSDFVYIDDVASAFRSLGLFGKRNASYLIGSGTPMALKNYVKLILQETGAQNTPNFGKIPFSGFRWDKNMFSINSLKKDCHYSPSTSFEAGIKQTFNWLSKGNI